MSIVSLKTLDGQNAFEFSCHFREGIELKKGATIQLISMSINKDKQIVINQANNHLIWRIGNNQSYLNHRVVFPSGVYLPDQIATQLVLLLNKSTILGQYKNFWKCHYHPAIGAGGTPGFNLEYSQAANAPALGGNTQTEFEYLKPGAAPGQQGTSQIVMAQLPTKDILVATANSENTNEGYRAVAIGSRGIFSNGGSHNVIVSPNNGMYNRTACGWVRNILAYPERYGADGYDAQTRIRMTGNDRTGFLMADGYVEVLSNPAGNAANVRVFTATNSGVAYPNNGWLDINLRSSTDLTALAGWGAFNFGGDHISLKVSITGNLNQQYTISHDTAGNGNFINEVVLNTAPGDFATTIKESFYPLTPITAIAPGLAGQKSSLRTHGSYDEFIHNPLNDLTADQRLAQYNDMIVGKVLEDQNDRDRVDFALNCGLHNLAEAHFTAGEVANHIVGAPLNLQFVMYMDNQEVADFVAGGGAIPNTQSIIGTDDATFIENKGLGKALGFGRIVFFATPAAGTAITTTGQIDYEIDEPSYFIELPDFNIKSYNGSTGDIMKAITMIPREELVKGDNFGTLHYKQAYPVPISLNLTTEQTIYQIRARIRDTEGRLETSLLPPTELILYLDNKVGGMESQIIELLKSKKGEQQDNLISENPVQKYI